VHKAALGLPSAVLRSWDRDIRFRADPVGGWRRATTDPIAVKQGQRVSLKLDNMLRSYRLSVW